MRRGGGLVSTAACPRSISVRAERRRPEIKLQIFPPPLLNRRRPDLEEHR